MTEEEVIVIGSGGETAIGATVGCNSGLMYGIRLFQEATEIGGAKFTNTGRALRRVGKNRKANANKKKLRKARQKSKRKNRG